MKCGICSTESIRLYRPYGSFFRPDDNRCNACVTKKQRGWYVPLCTDSDGTIWGYTSVPDEAIQIFLGLPEKSDVYPSWIGTRGWSDSELLSLVV